MCNNCPLQFCDRACPHYTGYLPALGYPHHTCTSCECGIYDGELYYIIGGNAYCEDCISSISLEELAEISGYPTITQLIEALGGKFCQDNF